MRNHTNRRICAMLDAIELGIDEDEFPFSSVAERELWRPLCDELETRLAKGDSVWITAA